MSVCKGILELKEGYDIIDQAVGVSGPHSRCVVRLAQKPTDEVDIVYMEIDGDTAALPRVEQPVARGPAGHTAEPVGRRETILPSELPSLNCLAATYSGQKRSTWAIINTRPAADWIISSPSPTVLAIGFSHRMCFLAFAA